MKFCTCASEFLLKSVKHVWSQFKCILKSTEVGLKRWADPSIYAGVQMSKAQSGASFQKADFYGRTYRN